VPIQTKILITPEQYLKIERAAATKSEYFHGEMFALAGSSREHNEISGNILSSFHSQIPNDRCKVYMSDIRVKVPPTSLYTYPDVIVACSPAFEDEHADTMLNPALIVEVLSESTEAYDRAKCLLTTAS